MRPVYKTREDDCLSACIATLLDIPCEDVPVFRTDSNSEQMKSCQRWLRKRGYSLVEVDLPKRGKRDASKWPWQCQDVPIYVILTISWAGGQFTHAVVGRLHKNRITVVHDPERNAAYPKRRRFSKMAFLLPNKMIDKRRVA